MSKVLVTESNLQDIATAIRNKNGSSDTYKPSQMASAITNIPGGGGTDWSEIGYSSEPSFVTSGFNYAKNIYDNWDSSITNGKNMYNSDNNLLFFPNVDCHNITDASYMFNSCGTLLEVPAVNFKPQDASYMFNSCTVLRNIDMSNFNISRLLNVEGMFRLCYRLSGIDLSNKTLQEYRWTNLSYMFQSACQYKTSNTMEIKFVACNDTYARNFSSMFESCLKLKKIDMSNFKSNVGNFQRVFFNCYNLEVIDISKLDLTTATSYSNCFYNVGSQLPSGTYTTVYVKDTASQNWILNLSGSDRPSGWTTANVIVKGS